MLSFVVGGKQSVSIAVGLTRVVPCVNREQKASVVVRPVLSLVVSREQNESVAAQSGQGCPLLLVERRRCQ